MHDNFSVQYQTAIVDCAGRVSAFWRTDSEYSGSFVEQSASFYPLYPAFLNHLRDMSLMSPATISHSASASASLPYQEQASWTRQQHIEQWMAGWYVLHRFVYLSTLQCSENGYESNLHQEWLIRELGILISLLLHHFRVWTMSSSPWLRLWRAAKIVNNQQQRQLTTTAIPPPSIISSGEWQYWRNAKIQRCVTA